jgi:hypothetical protein
MLKNTLKIVVCIGQRSSDAEINKICLGVLNLTYTASVRNSKHYVEVGGRINQVPEMKVNNPKSSVPIVCNNRNVQSI